MHCSDTKERLWPIQELLQLILDEASEMLEEGSDVEQDAWLVAIVDKMLANLREQFEIEEEDNYLADVLEQYPTWHPQALHLHQEHQLLQLQLHDIRSRMKEETGSGGLSPECRRQLTDWIAWYRQYQRRETALVQEAFVLEVGQGV